jgi:hypothetical protein
MRRYSAALAPDDALGLDAALDRLADEAFRRARAEGRREPAEAYAADALAALADSTHEGGLADAPGATEPSPPSGAGEAPSGAADGARPPGPAGRRPPPTKIIVRIDHQALLRGYTVAGEVCEVLGVGPVPVEVVRRIIREGDPFLAAVVTNDHDVTSVVHLGRRPTARQATALQWRDPECTVRGCHNRLRLQTDHDVEWRVTRHTTLDELDRLCPEVCHPRKTAGWYLEPGPPGDRRLLPPDHPDQARRPEQADRPGQADRAEHSRSGRPGRSREHPDSEEPPSHGRRRRRRRAEQLSFGRGP